MQNLNLTFYQTSFITLLQSVTLSDFKSWVIVY